MAQTQSTAGQQQSQTNVYPNSNQVAAWWNLYGGASGLSNWLQNNPLPQAQVAGPSDLMNQWWQQAGQYGTPDVSGAQTGLANASTQIGNVATQMGQNMAPTQFNIAPGQVNLPTTFQNGTPTVASTAAAYQYNPQQVSGPTVSAQQVSAPGAINPITGLAQVQGPTLQNYQMGPAQNVNAPNLNQFSMQAAAPISATAVNAPQSWTSPGTAQQYMDPYVQNAVNAQLTQAAVQNQQQIEGIKGQAAQAGAFGGSREAVEEANQNLGYQQLASTIEAQGLQQAYQQGMGQFTTEQQLGQQAQLANQQSGLQAAMANQQAQQQANVQNLSSFLQTQGLGAQTGLQAALANQQAGLTVGGQNLAAQLQTQGLGAQLNMQGQLANQSTGLQSALANQQAQEFGAGQQLQASLANQQAALQAAQATAGYNMQGQLANQASGLQAGLAAQQMGLQGAMANQAAQMQGMGMEYQGGLQAGLQTQNLGMQGQIAGGQLGLQGNQLNLSNLAQQGALAQAQGNLALQSGNLGLAGYSEGLAGQGALANAAQSQQGYNQQVADTTFQNQMNQVQMPMQAQMWLAQILGMMPSAGSTTTSTGYTQGQTDQPTFNFGQLAGSLIGAAGQVGAAYAGAAKGGLMTEDEEGEPHFAEGGLANVIPFRRRLYAPLRRRPIIRHPEIDAFDRAAYAGGLGGIRQVA